MLIIPEKKSASWQLVAVVMGQKTMQSGKKRRKIAKINPKISLISKDIFLVAVVFELFSRYDVSTNRRTDVRPQKWSQRYAGVLNNLSLYGGYMVGNVVSSPAVEGHIHKLLARMLLSIKCSHMETEVQPPALQGNYDRQTDWPTDWPTSWQIERPGYMEVTLTIKYM